MVLLYVLEPRLSASKSGVCVCARAERALAEWVALSCRAGEDSNFKEGATPMPLPRVLCSTVMRLRWYPLHG